MRYPCLPGALGLLVYAGGLAVIIGADNELKAKLHANITLDGFSKWMLETGLKLVPQRSKSTLSTNRKGIHSMHLILEGTKLNTVNPGIYLGIQLHKNLRDLHCMGNHGENVECNQDHGETSDQYRTNKNRRRLIMSSAESIALNGDPV